MPEISRFFGIVIKMYFGDHLPPHVHAEYGDDEALIDIRSLAVIAGHLPPRALGLVMEWAALRQRDLEMAWERASRLEPPGKVEPLR